MDPNYRGYGGGRPRSFSRGRGGYRNAPSPYPPRYDGSPQHSPYQDSQGYGTPQYGDPQYYGYPQQGPHPYGAYHQSPPRHGGHPYGGPYGHGDPNYAQPPPQYHQPHHSPPHQYSDPRMANDAAYQANMAPPPQYYDAYAQRGRSGSRDGFRGRSLSRPPSSGYDARYGSRGRGDGDYGYRSNPRPQHHNLCWTPDKGTFGGPNSNLPPSSHSPSSAPVAKDAPPPKASVPLQGQPLGPRPDSSILRRPTEPTRTNSRPQISVDEDEPQPGEFKSLIPLRPKSDRVRQALAEFKRGQEKRKQHDRQVLGRLDLRVAQNPHAVYVGPPNKQKKGSDQSLEKPAFKWYAVLTPTAELPPSAPPKTGVAPAQTPGKATQAHDLGSQHNAMPPPNLKKIKVQLPARKSKDRFRIVDRNLVAPGTKVARRRTRKVMFKEKPDTLFRQSRAIYMRSKSEKESVVGAGTFGTVFKAKNRYTGKLVALKLVKQEDWKYDGPSITFIREWQANHELKGNENITAILETMIEDGQKFMVFEYAPHDLWGLLHCDEFEWSDANKKDVLLQLTQGLAFTHSKGVMHRDMKTQNVLVTEKGVVKLADFGLSRFYDGKDEIYTNRMVTIWQRPLELCLGQHRYSYEIDIWGLGCIIVEVITGEPPFKSHGTELDQAYSIYEKLGTPTGPAMTGMKAMPWYELIWIPGDRENRFADLFKNTMSAAAIDLSLQTFNYDIPKRPTAEQVLQHAYFTQEEPARESLFEKLGWVRGEWHEQPAKYQVRYRQFQKEKKEYDTNPEAYKARKRAEHAERERKGRADGSWRETQKRKQPHTLPGNGQRPPSKAVRAEPYAPSSRQPPKPRSREHGPASFDEIADHFEPDAGIPAEPRAPVPETAPMPVIEPRPPQRQPSYKPVPPVGMGPRGPPSKAAGGQPQNQQQGQPPPQHGPARPPPPTPRQLLQRRWQPPPQFQYAPDWKINVPIGQWWGEQKERKPKE